jgi:hypothetical protein
MANPVEQYQDPLGPLINVNIGTMYEEANSDATIGMLQWMAKRQMTWLPNATGGTRNIGEVVSASVSADQQLIIPNTDRDPKVVGVVAQSATNGSLMRVQQLGKCLVNVSDLTNRGNFLSAVSGSTSAQSSVRPGQGDFAIALSPSGGSGAPCWALLIPVRRASDVVYLVNSSGTTVSEGSPVIAYGSADLAFTTTTTARDPKLLGIVLEESLPGALSPIQTMGMAQVRVSGAVVRGDFLSVGTAVGTAVASGTAQSGDFGIALNAKGTGTGLVWAIIGGMHQRDPFGAQKGSRAAPTVANPTLLSVTALGLGGSAGPDNAMQTLTTSLTLPAFTVGTTTWTLKAWVAGVWMNAVGSSPNWDTASTGVIIRITGPHGTSDFTVPIPDTQATQFTSFQREFPAAGSAVLTGMNPGTYTAAVRVYPYNTDGAEASVGQMPNTRLVFAAFPNG